MVWVRSEYAGELAVVLAWLSALIPWNVTYSPNVVDGSALLFVRFPFVQVRYVWGLPLLPGTKLSVPVPGWLLPGIVPTHVSALAFQRGESIFLAYQVWAVGALLIAVAAAFAAAYYAREDRIEALPVDPVRVLGTLLGGAGVVLAAATYLLVTRGFPGVPIPLGVALLLVFGGVLLTVERRNGAG